MPMGLDLPVHNRKTGMPKVYKKHIKGRKRI